ncbi:MAG: hypothetical protein AAB821_01590, partial [Patescibacteria group bacterium]
FFHKTNSKVFGFKGKFTMGGKNKDQEPTGEFEVSKPEESDSNFRFSEDADNYEKYLSGTTPIMCKRLIFSWKSAEGAKDFEEYMKSKMKDEIWVKKHQNLLRSWEMNS